MEADKNIRDRFYEFESLEIIHPSSDWDKKLALKLSLKSDKKSNLLNTYNLILLSVGLINAGIMVFSVLNDSKKMSTRAKNFELLSKELLIKPNP